ncbi:hypothetical protein FE391_28425 [Nonomuraea sp. KC401]|uniref:hypothetical protein n=1 Tax=unclassified Nonomuraea TaxID=2593643 RepID=UPI0010FE6F4C|nr:MULTISPECIES: hypothetical protein [unclassified Nonomuraea]NBE97631.1 hypothetical protein [Nonomuraea sp. K271]TLF63872.1 hypothetical protein FE391_28425 [Nonomuraea sp. KC401]
MVVALMVSMLPGVTHAQAPGALGTAGNLIRETEPRADGIRHVDTELMIAGLKAIKANTYVFPMAGDNVHWEDLRNEFLPAAAAAGINVWVLVYSPSQAGCCVSRPYKHDYVAWAREIATLSRTHPNLIGWTVDDYAYDLKTFTPEYVKQMRAAARAINPSLRFVPTVYYSQFTDAFIAEQIPLLEGVIFPFRDEPHRDTSWTWNLSYQVKQLAQRLPGTDVYLMPYAHPLSHAAQKPTVAYVEAVTKKGLEHVRTGELSGVLQYKLPFVSRDTGWTRPASDNLARTGNGRLSFVVQTKTVTKAGMWCSASRQAQLTPGAGTYGVSFWHGDDRGPDSPAGYHVKQLLLNGKVVWQQDVAANDHAWQRATVDLTAELAGANSAKLEWRLYERKGVTSYFTDVSVDDIVATGLQLSDPGVENAVTWTAGLARQGGPVYCSAQVYHQNYGADLGARIATMYAAG